MDWSYVSDGLGRVLGVGFQMFGLLIAWYLGVTLSKECREKLPHFGSKWLPFSTFVAVTFWTGAFGYFCYINYGLSYEGGDEMGRGGHWEQESEPTEKEKVNHGVFVFVIGTIPALLGAFKERTDFEDNKRKRAEEQEQWRLLRLEEAERELAEASDLHQV